MMRGRSNAPPNTGSHPMMISEVLGDVSTVNHHWQLFTTETFSPPIPFLPLDFFGRSECYFVSSQ